MNSESTDRYSIAEEPADIRYRGQTLSVKRGMTVQELMERYPDSEDAQVIAATVNNRVVSLQAKIVRSGEIVPVHVDSRHGVRLYRRHVTMMMYEVLYRLFPGTRIQIGQSISEGYFFKVSGIAVDDAFLAKLSEGMQALVAQRVPFLYSRIPVEEARRIFARTDEDPKRRLLTGWSSSHVSIVSLGDFVDLCTSPVAPHTGFFSRFRLFALEEDAFVLQFPKHSGPDVTWNAGAQPNLYKTHKESIGWSRKLGISHVSELNAAAVTSDVHDVIKVSEGHHEKKISQIADCIAARNGCRLVFIAGPSSAGKTTFAKRLSIQLKVLGIFPRSLSLDNYYVNRVATPLDQNGERDYEALEAIDLPLLNRDLVDILAGKEVLTPVYDFPSGTRASKDRWIPISLGANEVLIIEGIHGLNDALTPDIPPTEKFRIYINAMNPLAIDEHNRLNTSDIRLIRRLVRDRHYRGYSAAETIHSWPSVRRGEANHIFPFQESADVIFDTSLLYEFCVLKIFAERYLMEVPRSDPAYAEAYRLRMFLNMFVTILPGDIPQTSLLREFIGGSSFTY
ncbi:MAG: nucleoside kinase [Myxococcales bacterium]|nr:nucleoside kinase [Myxococcales bacterium]